MEWVSYIPCLGGWDGMGMGILGPMSRGPEKGYPGPGEGDVPYQLNLSHDACDVTYLPMDRMTNTSFAGGNNTCRLEHLLRETLYPPLKV